MSSSKDRPKTFSKIVTRAEKYRRAECAYFEIPVIGGTDQEPTIYEVGPEEPKPKDGG